MTIPTPDIAFAHELRQEYGMPIEEDARNPSIVLQTRKIKAMAMLAQGITRKKVARAMRYRDADFYAAFPVTDMDKLRSGQAVQIGKILAKRCRACGVTKELSKFYARATLSGCDSRCFDCGGRPLEKTKNINPESKLGNA